jgi:hypothetical protein
MLMSQMSAPMPRRCARPPPCAAGASVDLDRDRPLFFREAHEPARPLVVADERFRRDELHRDQTDAADPAQDQAELPVGDAGHRRQHQRRVDRNGAVAKHLSAP